MSVGQAEVGVAIEKAAVERIQASGPLHTSLPLLHPSLHLLIYEPPCYLTHDFSSGKSQISGFYRKCSPGTCTFSSELSHNGNYIMMLIVFKDPLY